MSGKKNIAILGGGVSALVTAFELTEAPNWRDFYTITIYQLGWRLGGKAASGRNPDIANRVEEHGFHYWWGFYDNAFNVLRRVYAGLDRPKSHPLSTWKAAMRPITHAENLQLFDGEWRIGSTKLNPKSGEPGIDMTSPLPAPADYVRFILEGLIVGMSTSPAANLPVVIDTAQPFWQQIDVSDYVINAGSMDATSVLKLAHSFVIRTFVEGDSAENLYRAANQLLGALMQTLTAATKPFIETNLDVYRAYVTVDCAIATVRGMIQDEVVKYGFDHINDYDYAEWLVKNGMSDLTRQSWIVRGTYNMAFCFKDGDPNQPLVEAGSALRILMRMEFTYSGGFMYEMSVPMGDCVIAPLYKLLEKRGVRFEFFHRVESLHLSADQKTIASVKIARQVTLKQGQYQPLIQVNYTDPDGTQGLIDAWPHEPLGEQIVEGESLLERVTVAGVEKPKYNLESFWTPWEDVDECILTHGAEYDLLIFGIPLGAVPHLCTELLNANNPAGVKWRKMVEMVRTTQTQALQLWSTKTVAEMGWPLSELGQPLVGGGNVEGTGYQLVDTWADLSQHLNSEAWPQHHKAQDASYFISVLQDESPELPPRSDHDFPKRQFERVKANSVAFIEHFLKTTLWPNTIRPNGEFDWDVLADLLDRVGTERINGQYWRANIDPSERYILSLPGTTQYRIRTDETGFDNLLITGDWIYNGANVGFVDSAFCSGMRTARAVTKRLMGVAYPQHIKGWADY